MKKLLLVVISIALLLAITSCGMSSVLEFERDGVNYYYEFSEGIKSVTNYHPYKFWKLPIYQELVQLGDGAGLENEGNVYFIYVVDTSIDPDSPKAYYTAEFDAETKELLCEEGEYFFEEAEKSATVERLIDLIDTVCFK